MKLLPRILADEDDEELPVDMGEPAIEVEHEPSLAPVGLHWVLLVAALALVPRLSYLFLFADPQNSGDSFTDTYHHWQIAYLTKEVGLSHGRLWDLRGWEYFWGPLHPLLMNLLFFATGSVDIVLARLLSLAFGSMAVVLIFLLCHRYWGMKVAIAAGAFAALSPVSVFIDDAGMAESIAIALVLLGIWLTPRRGFLAGLAWGIAAMARIEAWLFGAGLVVAWVLGRRSSEPRWAVVVGWLLMMALYFKFLLDQTGNPIYPLDVNFQFAGLGAGGTGATLSQGQQLLWIPLGIAVLGTAAGLGWSLWKRPAPYLLLTYGFGYSALSFATYLRYASEWKERRFEFPLDFAAILVAVLLFKLLPRRWPRLQLLGSVAAAAGLLATQVLWVPIQSAYAATESGYQDNVRIGRLIGSVYNRPEYRGEVINAPWDQPTVIYTMVRDGGVRGDRITSQFYDPFYYLPVGYHYGDHRYIAGLLLQCWLSNTKTRLLVLSPPNQFNVRVTEYEAFMADNPSWFVDTGVQPGEGWHIVGVQVPSLSQGDCARAAREAMR